jgi:hypothetical protein
MQLELYLIDWFLKLYNFWNYTSYLPPPLPHTHTFLSGLVAFHRDPLAPLVYATIYYPILYDKCQCLNIQCIFYHIHIDEANICMLYSAAKNVGKSMTLRIISKCEGVCGVGHPLLLSGGDQTLCGTSL